MPNSNATIRSSPRPTVGELFDLTGKRALVTGASGRLGGAFARALAEAGATVVTSSRELSRAASPVAYHTLKGGIVHMTRHLAVYWARDGVRVNCLSPGPFPPPEAPVEMVHRLCDDSPMKRMGLPHELKGAVPKSIALCGTLQTGRSARQ